MPYALVALLLLLATEATRCGPDDGEAAGAVFLAAPLFIAVGMGLLQLLRLLWRPARPGLRFGVAPSHVALGVCLLLGIAGVALSTMRHTDPGGAVSTQLDFDLVLIAILMVGPSYLSLLLVTWRVWLWRRPETAFTWSCLPPLLVLLLPALPMLSGLTEGWLDPAMWLWMVPGVYGLPTLAILVGLVVEALVRRRRVPAGAPPAG
ncbi:MAG TPA: hypothetical protein PK668_07330 [Myxococcota bacterium]|nr:hypothetical protein [Myxococcota bacterium]HRY92343.1 hypothetical protein [Myxococcota bacterium]HSA23015.1 hypothetical protein [Myxococcota bacterium]